VLVRREPNRGIENLREGVGAGEIRCSGVGEAAWRESRGGFCAAVEPVGGDGVDGEGDEEEDRCAGMCGRGVIGDYK
jgi:hypothetical protein